MSQSSVTSKIYSILQNETQAVAVETLQNYAQYQTEKISHDLLEMVWYNANNGMLLTDGDGIIIAANKAFCTLVSMNEEELIERPFTVIYDSTVDRKKIFDEYKERVENKNFSSKQDAHIHLNFGRSIHAEIMTSILIDEAQEVFVLSEYRDVSERKRQDQILRQSENRYRSLFENSVLPMYQSNIDGKFTNANSALLLLLGYESIDELRVLELEKDVYVHPEQRTLLVKNLQNRAAEKPTELELKKKDGSKIFVLAHSRILRDDHDDIIGFEGALENITEQKVLEKQILGNIKTLESAREELTKLNAQKDKILAIVSHDLRSPFGSILGFCDLLKNEFSTLSDEEKLEYIGFINDAAVQQLNLVNSMLDWSRLETGRVRLNFRSLDIGNIASEILTSLLGLAKKKDIKLRSTIPPNTHISADEQLVRQLLMNLVGNALKFTPDGNSISIDLKNNAENNTVIEVTDTGIGIPSDDLKKLFKVEEKYSRRGLQGEIGTGLGLPLCFEIMKKHNGSIEASSEEGKGTTFTITFQKHVTAECKKVLIVDDQKGNRFILSRFMKRISGDSEAFFAETGKEALEILTTNHMDLIITDYHMPTMDGLEFIRRIRADERLKNIPIILTSGDDMEHQMQSDTLTRVLQKPVIFNELKEVIERIKNG